MNIANILKDSIIYKTLIAVCMLTMMHTWVLAEETTNEIEVSYKDVIVTDGKVQFIDGSANATPVVNQTELSTGYYVVDSNVTISDRIIVKGDVHLILKDGYTLNANKGICVSGKGNNLTIYSQSSGSGTIIAKDSIDYYDAAIGGTNGDSGIITINGGNIEARGGGYGSGIGGGRRGDGHVIINGGAIDAINDDRGTGIGGGEYGTGNVTINGGDIKAVCSGYYGSGIGGGYYKDGNIIINGGVIEALGEHYGAGIGGGSYGDGNVIINGGNVTAESLYTGSGIGAGNYGNGTVVITGGTVEATGGKYRAGVGDSEYGDGSVTMGTQVKYALSYISLSSKDFIQGIGTVVPNIYKYRYVKVLDSPSSENERSVIITPSDITGNIGDELGILEADAEGLTSPITYKWYKSSNNINMNGQEIEGERASSYKLPLLEEGVHYYYATATDSTGTVASNIATITVLDSNNSFSLSIIDDGENSSGNGLYNKGQTVSINAGTKDGYTFKNWTTNDGGEFLNDNSSKTSYTMPGNNVTIKANWDKKSTATLPGGGGGGGSSGGDSSDGVPPIVIEKVEDPYMEGMPDGTFNPDGGTTRGEVAAIFARLDMRYDENIKYDIRFPDVSNWATNYIGFCDKYGIMIGYLDGEFKPENLITKEEFATTLIRSEKIKEAGASKFEDVKGRWCEGYVAALEAQGNIMGKPNGLFGALDLITRAEAARLVNIVKNYTITDEEFEKYENIFSDVLEDSWYYKDVVIATSKRKVKY